MHGGQSVPNFDYAMALGVAKTFRKCYFKSLAQALQFQKGLNKAEATQLAKTIQNEIGTDITMGTTAAFETALKEYFSINQILLLRNKKLKRCIPMQWKLLWTIRMMQLTKLWKL